MLRRLLIGFSVVEILVPRPVIAACERIGLENPAEARLRPRAIELARLEGLVVLWLLLRGRVRSPLVGRALGLAGVVAVLTPRPLIRLTQVVAYENTTELELKPWVEPAARLLGILYLTVVAFSGRVDAPTDDDAGESGSTVGGETGTDSETGAGAGASTDAGSAAGAAIGADGDRRGADGADRGGLSRWIASIR